MEDVGSSVVSAGHTVDVGGSKLVVIAGAVDVGGPVVA